MRHVQHIHAQRRRHFTDFFSIGRRQDFQTIGRNDHLDARVGRRIGVVLDPSRECPRADHVLVTGETQQSRFSCLDFKLAWRSENEDNDVAPGDRQGRDDDNRQTDRSSKAQGRASEALVRDG